tara:strand:- start:4294 stop:4533 length:240 start_codon:yes stop_codon:yes gene_type:complete
MLDILIVTMSLIATLAMAFLAYFLYKYNIKITKLKKIINELIETIDRLVNGYPYDGELPPEEFGKLYAKLKKKGVNNVL